MTKQTAVKKSPYLTEGGPFHGVNIWLTKEDGKVGTAVFTDHQKNMTGKYVQVKMTNIVQWVESNAG
jgi:hypothetical protein